MLDFESAVGDVARHLRRWLKKDEVGDGWLRGKDGRWEGGGRKSFQPGLGS